MSGVPAGALLLFLDGVGVGRDDPGVNPFSAARMPVLQELLGGRRLVREHFDTGGRIDAAGAFAVTVDATLGVAGTPQSGTGQTTLLTGENAATRFGRHFGSWVPTGLRDLLRTRNVLARTAAVGGTVAFANANPPRYPTDRRPAGPPLAALGAGTRMRGAEELRLGAAVASSLVNDRWIAHLPDEGIAPISAEEAGRNLARIAAGVDLTLFAHYDTDFAGHRRSLDDGVAVLERIDHFLGGLVAELPTDVLVVIASDHGNVEDVRTGHTRNEVPIVAWGPGSRDLSAGLRTLADVAPALLSTLRVG